jgi:hypothetical protein
VLPDPSRRNTTSSGRGWPGAQTPGVGVVVALGLDAGIEELVVGVGAEADSDVDTLCAIEVDILAERDCDAEGTEDDGANELTAPTDEDVSGASVGGNGPSQKTTSRKSTKVGSLVTMSAKSNMLPE